MSRCEECGMVDGHYAWCVTAQLDEIERIEAILYWQLHFNTHALTCGNDNCTPVQFGFDLSESKLYYRNGKLRCFFCDYEQEYIPYEILEFYKNSHKDF